MREMEEHPPIAAQSEPVPPQFAGTGRRARARNQLVLDAQHGGLHAVGLADDDLGRRWIVGDTFAPAYPYAAMRHKLVRQYRYGG
jgi:hypothetical protein